MVMIRSLPIQHTHTVAQPLTPPSQSASPPIVMQDDDALPPYWEARRTEDGRVFYVVRAHQRLWAYGTWPQ